MRVLIFVFFLAHIFVISLNGQSFFRKYKSESSLTERRTNIYHVNEELVVAVGITTFAFDGEIRIDKINADEGSIRSQFLLESVTSTSLSNSLLTRDRIYLSCIGNVGGGVDNYDMLLIKADLSGNIHFNVSYGDADRFERAEDIVINGNGEIMIGGYRSAEIGGLRHNSIVIKMDSLGNILWEKIIDVNHGSLRQTSITTDADNNIYALHDHDTQIKSITLVKLSSQGDSLWSKSYPIDLHSKAQEIFHLENGNLLITGYAFYEKYNGAPSSIYMEVDTNGNVIWLKDYKLQIGGVAYESRVKILEDGRIARVYDGFGYPTLMVTSSDGEIDFVRHYDHLDVRFPEDLVQLEDGSFVITGWINSVQDPDNYTMWLMRTDEEGYLTSTTAPSVNEPDYTIYPNPTSDFITIELPGNGSSVSITIIDALGKIVLRSSSYESIDVSSLNSGQYFINVFEEGKLKGSKSFLKL